MTEADMAALSALGLEAAFGLSPWQAFGDRIRRALDASAVTLMVGPADGSAFVDYMASADPGMSEAARHKPFDPSLPKSIEIAAQRLDLKEVAQIFEMVPERNFRRTAYYADFARHAGLYHRLGFSGLRGGAIMAPFGIHRAENARPFDEGERRSVLALKPFVKQALALRSRASLGVLSAGAGTAALDAAPDAVFILDGERRVIQANATAERMCRGPDATFRLASGPNAATGARLTASSRTDGAALDRLVRAVAIGGRPGGVLRLCTAGIRAPGLLVSVMPLPARLIDGSRVPGAEPGIALLFVRDLRRTLNPSQAVLRDAFALSASEAAIACAIGDGLTAADIAADRAVSLETVRSQIRSILRKTGATGLRDLERILALIPRTPA